MPDYSAGSYFDESIIVQIASAQEHTAAVTNSGLVLVCGSNQHQKLGLQNKSILDVQNKFAIVELLSHIAVKQVECSFFHTMALTVGG